MEWFPVGRNDSPGWRLDVVSLIAILGESLMARHIQPLSSSKLCFLPRILPAPQAFLRSDRASRLPSPAAVVSGVYSGNLVQELNYFANIIHPISSMKKYEIKVYNIQWSARSKTKDSSRRALVSSHKFSPINILTVASSFLTLAAFMWAIVIKDGAAVLALIAMSAASTLIGFASHWSPKLASRPTDVPVPDGDIIIITRDGAFIVVQCSEEIARELYIGPEECNYLVSDQSFRILVGIGTLLVILSVLFLGNCNWTMQAVIAVIYIILNALYWVVSLFQEKYLWDLSRYDWQDVTPKYMVNTDSSTEGGSSPSFTRTLWFAIQVTRTIQWATNSDAAPKTAAWKAWLELAEANCGDKDWDAVGEKDRLMREERLRVGAQRNFEDTQETTATLPVRAETA